MLSLSFFMFSVMALLSIGFHSGVEFDIVDSDLEAEPRRMAALNCLLAWERILYESAGIRR